MFPLKKFEFAQLQSPDILLSDTSNAAFCILMHPYIFFSFHELCIIHEDSLAFNVMQLAHGMACALCIGKTKQKKDNRINRSRRNKCDFLQFQFLCGDFCLLSSHVLTRATLSSSSSLGGRREVQHGGVYYALRYFVTA